MKRIAFSGALGATLFFCLAASAQEAFTAVWRAGNDGHYAWVSDWTTFEKKWEDLGKQGLRLVDLDTTVVGGKRQWLGAWRAGTDGHYLFVGLDWNAFSAKWAELGKKNFRLTRMKTYLEGGQRKWAGVWREGKDGYYLLAGLDYTAFTKKWDELAKQNFRLVDLETYVEGGKRVFAGIWAPGTDGYALLIGLDWTAFTKQWADLSKKNLRLVDLETYVEGGQKVYAGVWRAGADGHYLFGGLDQKQFTSKFDELSKQNMRLVRLAADNRCTAAGSPCCDDRCTGNLTCGGDSMCHAPAPAHHGKPMDVHWSEVDVNGFPFSPHWAAQETHPKELPDAVKLCNMNAIHAWSAYAVSDDPAQLKGCTDDKVALDIVRWVASGPICWGVFPGHANWLLGGVSFDGHIFQGGGPATSAGFDHDYDFDFKPMDKDGNLINNLFDSAGGDHLHLETWDSDGMERFNLPFWKKYVSQVQSSSAWGSSGYISYNGPAPLIEGKRALITGFISLDCAHSCHIELHPLLALAVQDAIGPKSEHWAFYATNYGGGGYCSSTNWEFDFPKENGHRVYKFKLPWRKGAKSFTFSMNSFIHWDTNDGFKAIPATVHATPGDGVVITLVLAEPSDHPVYEGEIALNWVMDPKAPGEKHAPPPKKPAVANRVDHDTIHKHMLNQLTPAQRKALPSIEERERPRKVSPLFTASKISGPIPAGKPGEQPKARAVHDAGKEARMKAHYEALKKAFGSDASFRAAVQKAGAQLHLSPQQLQDMLKAK